MALIEPGDGGDNMNPSALQTVISVRRAVYYLAQHTVRVASVPDVVAISSYTVLSSISTLVSSSDNVTCRW